jgi:phosphoribosylanthranilate isomerase
MIVKVCGNLYRENISEILTTNPDMLGFIFYKPSPRYAGNIITKADIDIIPKTVIKTGIFVNETVSVISDIVRFYGLDMVQLHGDETPGFCRELIEKGTRVIKAFRIDDTFDFSLVELYTGCTDLFLFDAAGVNYGGNGKRFNWPILEKYKGTVPFLLSGGITPEDSALVNNISHTMFAGVDLNSGFEKQPGVKDAMKIIMFLQEIR